MLQLCWQMPRETIFLPNHTFFILGPNGYDFLCHASVLFIDITILSKFSQKDCFETRTKERKGAGII